MEDSAPMRLWKEKHGFNKKVNSIWIDPENDKPEFKPFCQICSRYAVYIKNNGYECPNCGQEFKDETTESGTLGNKYKSEPMIAQPRSKKKHDRSDFPEGAFVKEDKQINPDGEEKDLILDGKDV